MSPSHSDPRSTNGVATRRPRWAAATVAALAVTSLGFVGVTEQMTAGADPASGVGPITVDDSGHWFEYAGNGEPYFMAGSGGPEGFLYYSDSRKQQIVDQLIDNDVRAVYIHAVRSDGGDGGADENPFFGNEADNGVDPAVLDEWDRYLSQLDDAGIVTWFHLYDDGARPFGACNPDLPDGEKEFVKTLVERFRGYQHLVWLPTEEHIIKACSNNSIDVEKAKALAAEIRKHDDVHPVGVHHNNGQTNQYLGNDDIDVFSQQVCQQSQFTSVDGIHDAGEFGEDVYVMAECHPWHKELLDSGQRTTLRQSFWSSVMAGGYVLFYDAWESNDPTEDMLADLGRINAFMDTTRFSETVPADQLAAAGTKWVLGNEAEDVYIAYSNTNPSSMGVQGMSAGNYDLGWFDPVTGETVSQTLTVGDGTASFDVPDLLGSEVALSIEPSDGSPPVTDPPVTDPPVTDPPVTDPPVTDPPVTDPPVTDPPVTVPPGPEVILEAAEDAFLQNAQRVNNDQIRLEHGGRTRTGYVRFDTSGLGDASTVRFDVTVGSDAGEGTISVSLGVDGDWTADTLTPTNAPASGDVLGTASGSFSPGQQLTFDLPASLVNGDVLDLVITHDGSGSDDVSLAASETGDGPTLVVDTNGDTPSTTTPPVTTIAPTTTTAPTTTVPTTNDDIAMVTFNGSDAVIANPERGFHRGASVVDSTGGSNSSVSQLESLRSEGITLARMYIRLDDYRNGPIPQSLIDNLDEVFGNARDAGIKLIPRFSYNFGTAPDATIERIEQHIEQVTPVLRANSDVITVLQAGFIGRWGEWNGSTNGLTNPVDQARVRNALLTALPTDRMAQFRYPSDIIEFEPTPLDASGAWSGSAQSRTGHKNDCFLANEGDAGTYNPLSRRDEFYSYLSSMTQFTVMGGETCQVSAGNQRTDCPTAIDEMELFNWDYLNIGFFGNTIEKWRNDGCFDEINNRLGYRFEMKSASASEQVAAGGRLDLQLEIENEGFGKLYNPRPINVVLVDDATGAETRIERLADARAAMPLGGETTTLDLSVTVPSTLADGDYSIHVELPDGASSLAGDPRFSIRMANTGTWQADRGTNDLELDVTVGGSAPDPGPVDPDPDPGPVDPDPDDPGVRSVLFVRGADRSGGFLEAGSDAARTEQLADIDNTSTNGGNHGWGTFASVLRREGFEVTQIKEGAERNGPTDGQPVDFTALDLDNYDLVVMGSNNAEYTEAQTDALDAYIRDGGAALFISDANFGGSWQDAPNSDQQFLDRYGVIVHQDAGTYGIDANEFVTPGHPVLSGVSGFDGEGVSPFDIGGASIDVTVLARAEGNVRLNPGNAQGPTRPSTPDDAVSWVADVGDGRVAGHYDRNTFFNANGAGTNIGRLDNEQYAVNLFTWLTDGAAAPPVDVPTTTTPPTVPPTTPPTDTEPSGVVLVDADTGATVAQVWVDGTTAVAESAFGSGAFSAVFDGPVPGGGSVAYELSGPISTRRVENVAPYTLFGDSSGDLDGRDVAPGRYSVTVTVFASSGGQGAVVDRVEAAFTIV